MEKRFGLVENTAVEVDETFTFRLCITKAQLQALARKSVGVGGYLDLKISRVSFQHGLLKNVANSFVLKILRTLTGVEVYYPAKLAPRPHQQCKNGVFISGMAFSLLADGIPQIQVPNMVKYRTWPCYGLPNIESANWCIGNRAKVPNPPVLNMSSWPDSADELKIDITITQYTKPELTEVNDLPALLSSANTNSNAKYFLSDNLSDVSILCETETFPAHLFILSQNSSVFAKMFEHEMTESKEKRVKIKDAKSNTVREMLRFFYTGKVGNLDDIAAELYTLANKYMVENLKVLCVRSLIKNVDAENAVDMYCFSRGNDIPRLTTEAARVIVANKTQIIKTYDDLREFMKTVKGPWAVDLFQLLWGTT